MCIGGRDCLFHHVFQFLSIDVHSIYAIFHLPQFHINRTIVQLLTLCIASTPFEPFITAWEPSITFWLRAKHCIALVSICSIITCWTSRVKKTCAFRSFGIFCVEKGSYRRSWAGVVRVFQRAGHSCWHNYISPKLLISYLRKVWVWMQNLK